MCGSPDIPDIPDPQPLDTPLPTPRPQGMPSPTPMQIQMGRQMPDNVATPPPAIPPAPIQSMTPPPQLVTGENAEEGGVTGQKSARATAQQLKAGTGTRIRRNDKKKKDRENELAIQTAGVGGVPGANTGLNIVQ